MTQTVANADAESPASRSALDFLVSLDPALIALLLDVDGTLIDIGPSPFEVVVPDELRASLVALYDMSGGALALVSGRPIRDLDRLFAPLRLPSVGGHGAEMRLADGTAVRRIDDLPGDLRRHLIEAATPGSGIEYEDKGYSVALHYRKAPQYEERLRAHVARSQAAFPAVETEMLPGKAMFEVKRPRIDKGDGVRGVMAHAPFAGRMPVFIGDDITDEAAFAAMAELGGRSLSVGFHFPGVAGVFATPAQVRRALRQMARL